MIRVQIQIGIMLHALSKVEYNGRGYSLHVMYLIKEVLPSVRILLDIRHHDTCINMV